MAKKILIVDDNQDILDALTLMLEDEGYTVASTILAEEVAEKIRMFKPDLILLDVLLSGHDGRDVCKILKQESGSKHIPLIMISAHPSVEDSALVCGADAFLAKPFDISILLETVATHLSTTTSV
jgi:DNA-binding response OmpR family regulator